jgi:hypothetical protein
MTLGLGRLYSIGFRAVSITAVQDLFYCKPAADKICILEAVYLSNVGIAADAGDAQEELLQINIAYVAATATVGSGGSAPTIVPMMVNDTAASFAQRANDTAQATSSGTIVYRHNDGWNVRVPYVYLPPPEHRMVVANAAALTVRLDSTPTDAILVSGTCLIREMP